jgi:sugar phosphate isomerase/epimerase
MLSHQYTFSETLRFFKAAGFDGVEICFEDLFFNLRPDLVEDYIIDHIRNECGELGLIISAVSNHKRYFFDDFTLEHMKMEIKKARRYGADVFIISAMNEANEKISVKGLWQLAASRVKSFCEVAEAEGVRIAIEPEPPSIFCSTDDFLRLSAEINSPALMINFDVGHAFLTDADIYLSIDLVKDKICHGHIENMKRGQHLHLLPDLGDMDLPAVLKKLGSAGFNGHMSLDLYNYQYAEVAKDAVATLHEMIKNM